MRALPWEQVGADAWLRKRDEPEPLLGVGIWERQERIPVVAAKLVRQVAGGVAVYQWFVFCQRERAVDGTPRLHSHGTAATLELAMAKADHTLDVFCFYIVEGPMHGDGIRALLRAWDRLVAPPGRTP